MNLTPEEKFQMLNALFDFRRKIYKDYLKGLEAGDDVEVLGDQLDTFKTLILHVMDKESV